MNEINTHLINAPLEVIKLSLPCTLYAVQNNLLYEALTRLDAVTYQVTYQLKILTTALFSVLMLKKEITMKKWGALAMLALGVVLAQSSTVHDAHSATLSEERSGRDKFVGLICVCCAACTSGFSGVYFERILKGSPKVSLWVRNLQMGAPSVLVAFFSVFAKDHNAISERGFFHGYNKLVWAVICVQAVGGLLVAIVVKYADSVLKVFATSFSIIVSSFVTWLAFGFAPTMTFMLGAALVLSSTIIYSGSSAAKKDNPLLPINKIQNQQPAEGRNGAQQLLGQSNHIRKRAMSVEIT